MNNLAQKLASTLDLTNRADAIDRLSALYEQYGVDNLQAASRLLDKSQKGKLTRLVLARNKQLDAEALGDFKIGDRVIITSNCDYQSLTGFELQIAEVRAPWLCCTRPSGSFAPGLLKSDIRKFENGNQS